MNSCGPRNLFLHIVMVIFTWHNGKYLPLFILQQIVVPMKILGIQTIEKEVSTLKENDTELHSKLEKLNERKQELQN